MKIKIYENGALTEEIFENGFVCDVRYKDINILNIGDGNFSPCTIREISIGGESVRIRITTSPDVSDIMKIINRFDGMNMITVENENAKLEITV